MSQQLWENTFSAYPQWVRFFISGGLFMSNRPISTNIKYYRELFGYSERDVAEMLGMDTDAYRLKEDNVDIDLIFLNNLAIIFNTDIKTLISEKAHYMLPYIQKEQIILTDLEQVFIENLRKLPLDKIKKIYNAVNKECGKLNN